MNDVGDVDVPGPEWPVHTVAHSIGVGDLAGPHLVGEIDVDVLEVRVRHALR